GDDVNVEFVGITPLRLEKELVRRSVGKLYHLVLDGGAIARPSAFNSAAVQRRTTQIATDNVVRFLCAVGDPAGQLFHVERCSDFQKTKSLRQRVSELDL